MLFPLPMQVTGPAVGRGWPVANLGLILANAAAWVVVDPGRAQLGPGSGLISLVTYSFVHAGLVHLILNMWALWVFGNALNRRLGTAAYLALYFGAVLFVGLVAKFAATEPVVGSSAGVFAVTAAAALLLRSSRVQFLLAAVFPLTLLLAVFRRPTTTSQWFVRWGWYRLRLWWGLIFVPLLVAISLVISTDWHPSQLVHLLGLAPGIVAVPLILRGTNRSRSHAAQDQSKAAAAAPPAEPQPSAAEKQ